LVLFQDQELHPENPDGGHGLKIKLEEDLTFFYPMIILLIRHLKEVGA
jgi:hypothetical protein